MHEVNTGDVMSLHQMTMKKAELHQVQHSESALLSSSAEVLMNCHPNHTYLYSWMGITYWTVDVVSMSCKLMINPVLSCKYGGEMNHLEHWCSLYYTWG